MKMRLSSLVLQLAIVLGKLSQSVAYITFPAAESVLRQLKGLDQLSNSNGIPLLGEFQKTTKALEEAASKAGFSSDFILRPFETSFKWSGDFQSVFGAVKSDFLGGSSSNVALTDLIQKIQALHDSVPFASAYDVGLIVVAGAMWLTLNAGQLLSDSNGTGAVSPTTGGAESLEKLESDELGPYGQAMRYNPALAADYFSRRPRLVFTRALEIGILGASFGLGLLADLIGDKLTDREQEELRADELTDTLTRLGPTFIKVGQSLSIRTDLLRPAYIKGLTKLQDKVPSFPTVIARQIIEEELGKPIDEVFASGLEPSATVVAAASLGQVFKAKLRSDGSEVAVKVQRPGIIDNVALDMHLLRSGAPLVKKLFALQTDIAGVIDDWGVGFVNELDYNAEAKNAEIFMEAIAKTPLSNAVFAPPILHEVSSRRVLTTRWIDGEKLDASTSADVTQLCSIAMNTYLTMMLEMPILHCDPHPGNLKRTPDGKLCILDWGLVTSLEPDLQLSYIEHIAHLTSRDYANVPMDLVKLGFVPRGMEQAALEEGVVEVLTDVYSRFAGGGGAAKIDVNAVLDQMNGLAQTYGRIFQLPPYFAYIARAFGVLEGIGLSSDPDYAIVGECLPYISQRLLTDKNPRTGGALGTFIFGADRDKPDRVIDADRMELLLSGFSSYSKATDGLTNGEVGEERSQGGSNQAASNAPGVSATPPPSSSSPSSRSNSGSSSNTNKTNAKKSKPNAAARVEKAAAQLIDLLLAKSDDDSHSVVNDEEIRGYIRDNERSSSTTTTQSRGGRSRSSTSRRSRPSLFPPSLRDSTLTPLQQLVLEEVSKLLGAGIRTTWSTLRDASGKLPSGRSVLGSLIDPLGLFKGTGLVEPDELDERTLESARRLITVLQRTNPAEELLGELTPDDIGQVAVSVSRRLWDRREGLAVLGAQLTSVMLQQTARRLERPRGFNGAAAASSDVARPTAPATATATATARSAQSVSSDPSSASSSAVFSSAAPSAPPIAESKIGGATVGAAVGPPAGSGSVPPAGSDSGPPFDSDKEESLRLVTARSIMRSVVDSSSSSNGSQN